MKYKVVVFKVSYVNEQGILNMNNEINELAQLGWRLISVNQHVGYAYTCFFEKTSLILK